MVRYIDVIRVQLVIIHWHDIILILLMIPIRLVVINMILT